jgi:hypothetical protein
LPCILQKPIATRHFFSNYSSSEAFFTGGGPDRIRTGDLLHVKQMS